MITITLIFKSFMNLKIQIVLNLDSHIYILICIIVYYINILGSEVLVTLLPLSIVFQAGSLNRLAMLLPLPMQRLLRK